MLNASLDIFAISHLLLHALLPPAWLCACSLARAHAKAPTPLLLCLASKKSGAITKPLVGMCCNMAAHVWHHAALSQLNEAEQGPGLLPPLAAPPCLAGGGSSGALFKVTGRRLASSITLISRSPCGKLPASLQCLS